MFDIHQYSEHIIDVLKLHEESEDVPFTEIVSGKDPHEICRIFTASLQLVSLKPLICDMVDLQFTNFFDVLKLKGVSCSHVHVSISSYNSLPL